MHIRSITKILVFQLILFSLLLPISPTTAFTKMNGSRASVVMDASTGEILYAKNPDLLLPPASTTKLMTAIVVMERADLTTLVTMSKNACFVPSLKKDFKIGDRVTVEALLYAALLESSNIAASALAEAVAGSEDHFVQFMNQKAASIGACNTRFINPHGLPGPNQYTTAAELSKIMRYALSFRKLREIMGTPKAEFSTEKGRIVFLKHTDKLLWSDESHLGGKTGFTLSAGHCFVCAAEREEKTVIISILGSPSRKSLWEEAHGLINKGFQMMINN